MPKEAAEQWMKQNGCSFFFETSSKTSENVVKAFEEVAKQLFYMRMTNSNARITSFAQVEKKVELAKPEPTKKKECCS